MRAFERVVLAPRGLDHRIQFTGPTGTNAVEAALKLARKVTGRTTVVAFSNAFHGVTLGALAMSGGRGVRAASRALLHGVHRLPFEGYQGASAEDLLRYERQVADPSGGLEPPAAFIVETVQGEGGLNVASTRWLRALAEVAKRLGALLIVDDVQAGCGRTGRFFSFERAGIEPDIVCLAKSQRNRPADGDRACPSRHRSLGSGRAQRHLSRQRARLCGRDRGARALGGGAGGGRRGAPRGGDRGLDPAPARALARTGPLGARARHDVGRRLRRARHGGRRRAAGLRTRRHDRDRGPERRGAEALSGAHHRSGDARRRPRPDRGRGRGRADGRRGGRAGGLTVTLSEGAAG
ncbi:aminotransferase class III-fold pyridoxal phosphate-dependent enzyme [Chenggangzhangella methanolivorans]|uniref:Aminotransferase class III-fold pyridoxal phosphate-dependent enzyme n=1 Tax=Chenggangzhangella methanolivorans TaxID=1437009 RepID=A0A9E6R940_9HYPH|nr:aminotransferase class III-fold pyridoxal phosphate-dependent enzyme [Chenggangzhangella methanolivorans]